MGVGWGGFQFEDGWEVKLESSHRDWHHAQMLGNVQENWVSQAREGIPQRTRWAAGVMQNNESQTL